MKDKPAKTFDRHQNVIDLLDKGDALNIDATLNDRPNSFVVKQGAKYVIRNTKGPNRYALSDTPWAFKRESEAMDAARAFKGATVIKGD